TVEAGVTRQQLNLHLRDSGLFFPVDPGGHSTLGGMAATRASGTNAVRYGTMRDNVISVTAVMANGDIIRTASRARKSSAGYELPLAPTLFLEFHGTTAGTAEQMALVRDLAGQRGATAFDLAADEDRRKQLWRARHDVHYAIQSMRPNARVWSTDVCVPISN